MRARNIIETILVILVVAFGVYGILDAIFPRLHNDLSCNDTMAENAAQSAALEDARSRASAVCSKPRTRCKFAIHGNNFFEAGITISPIVVETDFFEGCIYKDDSLDEFIYDLGGRFLRTQGAPYAIPYAMD